MTAVRAQSALRADTSAPRAPESPPNRVPRITLGLAAAVLVIAAGWLPIWEARLAAPQYPQGLSLTASADGVSGDLAEVNELNHYVGMRAFDPADAPEMMLWGPTIVLAVIAVGVATVLPRRHVLGRLARLGLWMIPIGALADIQLRLYQYGHSVQPDAPIRIDPFTPLVIGPTDVMNFTTWAYPGAALWCLAGAAFLLTFWDGTIRLAGRGIDVYRRWGVEEEDR